MLTSLLLRDISSTVETRGLDHEDSRKMEIVMIKEGYADNGTVETSGFDHKE